MRDAQLAVRKLTSADVDEAGELLARAFFDYAMFTWLMPDTAHRHAALPAFMRVSVRWGLLLDQTYGVGDPLRGVAIWAPPGTIDLDLDPDDSTVRYADAVAAIGAEAKARLDHFGAEQGAVRTRELGPRTWYLSWLGVDTAHQRSGAGAALLRDMLSRLDAAGDDAYLETENAINVPYYIQQGFDVITEGGISGGGPQFWTMHRPASAP